MIEINQGVQVKATDDSVKIEGYGTFIIPKSIRGEQLRVVNNVVFVGNYKLLPETRQWIPKNWFYRLFLKSNPS